jgi:hypothetical protein
VPASTLREAIAAVCSPAADLPELVQELAVCSQEVLRSFNATSDDILVRRQSGGRLELARKVIGAELGDGSHLLQRRITFEIFP